MNDEGDHESLIISASLRAARFLSKPDMERWQELTCWELEQSGKHVDPREVVRVLRKRRVPMGRGLP